MANRLDKIVKKAPAKKQKPIPVKIVYDDAPKSTAINRVDDMKWRARDDIRVLQQAAEIQRDKARMRAAKSEAQAQVKQLSSVCGGKK